MHTDDFDCPKNHAGLLGVLSRFYDDSYKTNNKNIRTCSPDGWNSKCSNTVIHPSLTNLVYFARHILPVRLSSRFTCCTLISRFKRKERKKEKRMDSPVISCLHKMPGLCRVCRGGMEKL